MCMVSTTSISLDRIVHILCAFEGGMLHNRDLTLTNFQVYCMVSAGSAEVKYKKMCVFEQFFFRSEVK